MDLILLCVNQKINNDVQDFVFNSWRVQDLAKDNTSLYKIAISSWEHHEKRYFGELMKIISGHFDCDKIMARIMISHVYMGTLLEIVNFLPNCTYYDELLMFHSVLIQRGFRGLR
uniref:Uncharacterized protein n=1 Tax=viral metagenome TaxID=1070528 RepID=A0A6C0CAB4_9ZZZZ